MGVYGCHCHFYTVHVDRGGALAQEQKKAIASELSRRLSSSSANNAHLKTAALGTLEKMG